MRKFLQCYLWVMGLLLINPVMAQNNVVTGTVVSAGDNAPMPGVTVALKGKTQGTVTDADGRFSISAQSTDILVFSFIGFETFEQQVGASTDLSIAMKESLQNLQEVVVVGYGTQKKGNLTGAMASIDTKVLDSRPISDAGRGLQGAAAGLNVVVPSGEVGSDPIMRIRGHFGSINGNNAPLILLDNVEIPSIQMVNPNDIESISILKDAASASIYGTKGAFGVILITSKKGAKKEGVSVNYSGNFSFQNMSKKMEMGRLDAMEYTLLAFERSGATRAGAFWIVTREGYEKAREWEQKWGGVVKPDDPMLYGRDWYVNADNLKIGLRTYDPYDYMVSEWTPMQNHNLSVNGMSGKTTYNIGVGYLDQEGIIKPAKEDNFQRYNGSIQFNTEINNWLKLNAGAIYSKRVKNYPYVTNSTTADPWLYLYRWASTYPMTTEDGKPVRSPNYEMSAANTAFMETNYSSFNGGLTITPAKDWEIKFDYTHANQEYINRRPGTRFTAGDSWSAAVPKYDAQGNRIYMNSNGEVVPSTAEGAMAAYQLNYTTYTAAGSNPDHMYRYVNNWKQNTVNLYSTYNLRLNENHAFKVMAGMNLQAIESEDQELQVNQLVDLSNPQFPFATGAIASPSSSLGQKWESSVGFFGRLNYNFKEKYFFEANLRTDGSSKFPTALQWALFPSFSAGWRLNEEAFMDFADGFLDELKLRGSWGSIGDQSLRNDLYVPTMQGAYNSFIVGNARLYQFGTPPSVVQDITWQRIETLDFGVDFRALNGKLGFTFDWFQRDTKNMVVPMEGLTTGFGAVAPLGNFGHARTKGFELQLDYTHLFDNGLRVSVTGMLGDAVSKVVKYGSTKSIDNYYVGKTIGEIWGYETDRLYQKEDFAYDGGGNLILVTSPDNFQVYQLADENGATQGKLQAGNFIFGPGDVKFKDLNGDGVINDGNRLIDDHGDLKVIGNSTPRYEYSFRLEAQYRGFDFGIFFQGVGKREIWGDGFLAIPGYNSADGAMPQAFAGNFWREDRTDAFYPRPYNQAGSSTTLNMQRQTRYLLDMSYLRIKNITLGYTLPASITEKARFTKVRVYGSLENIVTWDKLGSLPIDPEVISGYSMWNTSNYNLGRTGVGVPAFKSASVGVQLSF